MNTVVNDGCFFVRAGKQISAPFGAAWVLFTNLSMGSFLRLICFAILVRMVSSLTKIIEAVDSLWIIAASALPWGQCCFAASTSLKSRNWMTVISVKPVDMSKIKEWIDRYTMRCPPISP